MASHDHSCLFQQVQTRETKLTWLLHLGNIKYTIWIVITEIRLFIEFMGWIHSVFFKWSLICCFNNWRRQSITINSMSNFGLVFFGVQMSWIFACGLQFHWKSQPCIKFFFRWFALHFWVKTYTKNSAVLFYRTNNRRLCDTSLISLFGKTKGFIICFSFNNR